MPLIARGRTVDLVITFHPCQPLTTTESHSTDVYVANIGVHRFGDTNTTHLIGVPPVCPPHQTNISICSVTVFANNVGVARQNDQYTMGEAIRTVTQISVFADGP